MLSVVVFGCSQPQHLAVPTDSSQASAAKARNDLEAIGINVGSATDIDFLIAFKDVAEIEAAAKELRTLGFETKTESDHSMSEWNLTAKTTLVPDSDQFASAFEEVNQVAKHHRGSAQGWSAGEKDR